MTDINNYFQEYNLNTFEDVKAHFEDSCKINETDEYYLLRYRNREDNSILSLLRGAIFNKLTNRLVCYPLTGAVSLEEFQRQTNFDDIVIEESIDGTLINLWYDNGWHVSTRTCVDANESTWVRDKSYKVLFDECEFNVDELDTNYCHSLVLCHPENRIVTPYTKPQLYHVLSRNMTTYNEEYMNIGLPKPTVLKLGNELNVLNVNSFNDLFRTLDDLEFDKEGFMLFSKDRRYRIKLKGANYEHVKEIRGNNRNIKYRLLELHKDNKLEEFLNFYPEHRDEFNKYNKQVIKFEEKLFNYYIKCHMKKAIKHTDLPYEYKIHIYNIHSIYINELKAKNKFVTLSTIQDYLKDLHPAKLMYSVNYSNYSTDLNIVNEKK